MKMCKLGSHEIHTCPNLATLTADFLFFLPFPKSRIRQREIIARHHELNNYEGTLAAGKEGLKVYVFG